jgi:hypothetical protein
MHCSYRQVRRGLSGLLAAALIAALGTVSSPEAARAAVSDSVTVTQSGTVKAGMALSVLVLTGAAESGGASYGAATSSGSPSHALTPTHSGSKIYWSITNGSDDTELWTMAANNSDTITGTGNFPTTAGDWYIGATGGYTGTVTAGTPVTVGASGPTDAYTTLAAYEVPPSGTEAVDASTPAFKTSTGTTITSATFTPPAGSVLVADVSSNAAFGTAPGLTVTDTSGLTWTRRAFSSGTSLSSFSAIYTATVGQAPVVTTSAATGVTSAGATLNGTVNPEGASTTYQFDYGTTTAYGTTVPSPAGSAGSGSSAVSENFALTGLTASTTYHYRIKATNSRGTTLGADQQFTTAAAASSDTVTATVNGTPAGVSEKVFVLTGATEAGGAQASGSAAAGSAANWALTPVHASSLPLEVLYDETGGTSGEFTAAASNTLADNSIQHDAFADGYYTGTVTAGTPVTLGTSAPTTNTREWASYEVQPSGAAAPARDASSPAVVKSSTANTVTTASFTPPAGAVLVALVTGNNATTSGVTDAAGLTWTQRSQVTGGGGIAAVYTATAGSGTGGRHFMDFGPSAQCPNSSGTGCTGNPNAYPLSDSACASSIIQDNTERIPANASSNAVDGPANPADVPWGPYTDPAGLTQMDRDALAVRGYFNASLAGTGVSPTTDNILAWAACKWGWNEDWLRAEAVIESSWKQSELGDLACGLYHSYGILQIRDATGSSCTLDHSARGGYPYTSDVSPHGSTALNAEAATAYFRACMDGTVSYLYGGQTVAQIAAAHNWAYVEWGCVGSWYSGDWYSSAAQSYITEVQNDLASRTWQGL